MDLTRILHVGDKLFTPIIGEVIVDKIAEGTDYPIRTRSEKNGFFSFTCEGKYNTSAEAKCLLLPRKGVQWNGSTIYEFLKPRPGDILKSCNNAIFIFEKFESNDWYVGRGLLNEDLFYNGDLRLFKELMLGRATGDEIGYFKERLKDFSVSIEDLKRKMNLNCILRQPQYYFISSESEVLITPDVFGCIDNQRYKCGNYFQTKEKAEEILNKIKPLFEKHKYERSC